MLADPGLSAEVEHLARAIAGEGADGICLELAQRIAEAEIELSRVRRARHELLARTLANPYWQPTELMLKLLHFALQVEATEVTGKAARLPAWADRALEFPEGPEKFLLVLTDLAEELAAFDRYERRARSRRKFAIRAYDAARRWA